MSMRTYIFPLLALAACNSTPPSDTIQTRAIANELAQTRSLFDGQISMLASLLAQRVAEPWREAIETPDSLELAARLATLNERLDDLIQRLPPPTAHAEPVEASAQRKTKPDPSDAAAIAMLQQGILLTERLRDLSIENITNATTTGFKRRHLQLSTTLYPGTDLQVPAASTVVAAFTTGTLAPTERCLDIAIDGGGFFTAIARDGNFCYTRNGNFHIDTEGKMVTSDGLLLVPQITVSNDTLEISVDPQGLCTARMASSPDSTSIIGRIKLTRFVNTGALEPAGQCSWRANEACGAPITGIPGENGFGDLKQGFLERSNVTVLNELVNLQTAERQRSVLRRLLATYGIYVR